MYLTKVADLSITEHALLGISHVNGPIRFPLVSELSSMGMVFGKRENQHPVLLIYHVLTGSLCMRTRTVLLFVIVLLVTILAAGCTSPGIPPQDQPGVTPTVTLSSGRTPTSPEAMVAFVEKAYEYAKIHGKEAALAEFNNQSGRFVQGELYIFAYDLQANTLALPFQPQLVGTNRWNLTDVAGNHPLPDNIRAAQSGGGFSPLPLSGSVGQQYRQAQAHLRHAGGSGLDHRIGHL